MKDLCSGHRRADWDAAGEPLCRGHYVGDYAPVLDGPEPPGSPEACLDLVGDEEQVVLVADLSDALDVAVRGHHDAAFSLDGLEDHGGVVLVDLGFQGGEFGVCDVLD